MSFRLVERSKSENNDLFPPSMERCVWCSRPFFDGETITVAKHAEGEQGRNAFLLSTRHTKKPHSFPHSFEDRIVTWQLPQKIMGPRLPWL